MPRSLSFVPASGMLDCAAMSQVPTDPGVVLRLGGDAGHSLAIDAAGTHVGLDAGGELAVVAANDAQLRFTLDARGLWLDLHERCPGVHVNGRPVRRMAMLRSGDSVYLGGREILVLGRLPADAAELPPLGDVDGDLRAVLRGHGGQHHGRAFALERPSVVGSGSDADIRLDEAGVTGSRARLECLANGRVLLRDLAGRGCLVNGHRVGDAILLGGDQLVLDAHHRFVLETPGLSPTPLDADTPPTPIANAAPRRNSSLRRLPWVLVAALLIAGLLSLLLFHGGR